VWEEAHAHLREVLDLLSNKLPTFPIPRGTSVPSSSILTQDTLSPAASDGKRKAPAAKDVNKGGNGGVLFKLHKRALVEEYFGNIVSRLVL
jgi:hypothetical protein